MNDCKLCDERNVANNRSRRNPAPLAEPSKQTLRIKSWKKIKNARIGVGFIFNRIPLFVGIEKAAAKLCETDEFKMIGNVKVSGDRVLHDVMLRVLDARKTLFVNALRESIAIFNRVDVPADVNDNVKREVLGARNAMHKYLTAVDIENRVPLGMIVIGSLIVSRQGQRIGRGKGATDLEIGLLIELGVITPNTCIVTIVHDIQVVDYMPTKLFQKFDTPIDLIVTPTQLIHVTNALPRPAGIFWDLLTERHLRAFPVLKRYKLLQEAAGKTIVLRNSLRNANVTRMTSNVPAGNGGGDGSIVEQEPVKKQQRRRQRNRRWHRQQCTNNDNRETVIEVTPAEPPPALSTQNSAGVNKVVVSRNNTKASRRRTRPPRDFCVKLTNLTCDVRIKDVKMELRKRNCNPLSILWIGRLGKCYLHFGNRSGKPSTKDDIDKVMTAINDLSLTIMNDDVKSNENDAGVAVLNKNQNGVDNGGGGDVDGCVDVNGSAQMKVINVHVELVKYGRLNKDAPAPMKTDQDAINAIKMKNDIKKVKNSNEDKNLQCDKLLNSNDNNDLKEG